MSTGSSSDLRLGILGMSPGNGHPYSWSAICNGYDAQVMADCPFAAIPEYLSKRSFPRDALSGAHVTHVWTQDRRTSEHIARAARIPNVVERPELMIGAVDGLLLARDDAENHLAHAAAFLDSGLPVYIDKPVAVRTRDALALFGKARYREQIFTCTALRYAEELQLAPALRERVGSIRFIDAIVPKEWAKYAVHVIEPVLAMLPESDSVRAHHRVAYDGVTQLSLTWASGVQTRFTSTGAAAAPIAIAVHGASGCERLVFSDAFSAFKAALVDFVRGIQERRMVIPRETTLRVVELIELGMERE